jgi:hypothetical protein
VLLRPLPPLAVVRVGGLALLLLRGRAAEGAAGDGRDLQVEEADALCSS